MKRERAVMKRLLIFIACILSISASDGCGYYSPLENTAEEFTDRAVSGEPETYIMPCSPLIEVENPEQENMADMLQRTSAGAMVKIVAQELSGSGVIYRICEDKLVVVTAGHILEQARGEVWLTFFDDFVVESLEYVVSGNADLAFVKVEIEEIPQEHLQKYYCVNTDKESFDALKGGDGIIAMGSKSEAAGDAYEGRLVESWIYVEDFAQYMMLARVEVYPGMSGGGLFDMQGHFLGILCGTDEDGETAVVPLNVLEAEIVLQQICSREGQILRSNGSEP